MAPQDLRPNVVLILADDVGLGLLLSHATVNRYGGSVALHNRRGGGVAAVLRLPRQDHD